MTKLVDRTFVRRALLGACTAASIAALAACGSSDESDTTTAASGGGAAATSAAPSSASVEGKPLEGKTIAFVSAAPIEYYQYSARSAEMAVEQLGGTVKHYNSNGDVQKELANVRAAITQGVDGALIIPLSTAGEKTELRLLRAADIPAVMLYGYDPTLEDEAAGFVQVDFRRYGELVGREMSRVVPEGDVAIITGLPGRAEVPEGSAGLREGFGDDSRIVAEVPGDWDRQKAFSQTQSLITKYPDLKGLMVQNDDMAIGAVEALGSKISQVAVSSMNGSPEGLKLLREGKIKAMAGNSIPIESSQAVRYLANAIDGGENAPKLCFTQIDIDTPTEIRSKSWIPTDELITEGLRTPCANAEE